MRIIDADRLKEVFRRNTGHDYADIIDAQPSVEPQEPKTGYWIEKDGFDGDVYYDCSDCGESWTTIEGTPWDNGMKYCPNCGAPKAAIQKRSDEG